MTKNTSIFQRRCETKAFAFSTAYVNQSLKNWRRSTFYICASFADLLRESVSRAKLLLGFDRTCVVVHEKRVNIKMAIVMAPTVRSCSTAMSAAKSIV